MLKKVTVVIANYNCQDYVCNAITSALRQTYKNINIVVVDDCSTDWSRKNIYTAFFKHTSHVKDLSVRNGVTCKEYISEKLHVIQLEKNVGPAEARNIGISRYIETSEYFMILDADDEMFPNKVLRMVEVINSSPNIGVVYGDYVILNTITNNKFMEFKQSFSLEKLRKSCIVHSNSLISRDALLQTRDENGFYDKRIKGPEDYDLWLRIARKNMIVHVPEFLSLVRVTGNNISSTAHSEFNENFTNGFAIINSKGFR